MATTNKITIEYSEKGIPIFQYKIQQMKRELHKIKGKKGGANKQHPPYNYFNFKQIKFDNQYVDMDRMDKNKRSIYMLSTGDSLGIQRDEQEQSERMEKIFHANCHQKWVG